MIARRFRAVLERLSLLGASLLVCFGALELGLRIYYGNPPAFYDPQVRHVRTSYGYKPEPRQRGTYTMNQPVVTNAEGFVTTTTGSSPVPPVCCA